ncbi:MAG: molybdenum cofactor biosynthesis protein MoaE [Dokdonella sp.]
MRFRLSDIAIDGAAERRALAADAAGACVVFEGWVRDHNDGRSVQRLDYQAYAELANNEGERIIAEAISKFEVTDARCIHRIGNLVIGDIAIWVGVAAAHRGSAFDACRWIVDEVKLRVPIWKNEHYADGDSGWLHPDGKAVAEY